MGSQNLKLKRKSLSIQSNHSWNVGNLINISQFQWSTCEWIKNRPLLLFGLSPIKGVEIFKYTNETITRMQPHHHPVSHSPLRMTAHIEIQNHTCVYIQCLIINFHFQSKLQLISSKDSAQTLRLHSLL